MSAETPMMALGLSKQRLVTPGVQAQGLLVKGVVPVKADDERNAEISGDGQHLDSHWPEMGEHELYPSSLEVAGDAVPQEGMRFQPEERLQEVRKRMQARQARQELPVFRVEPRKLAAM